MPKKRPPELSDPLWLRREYLERDLSTREIALSLGCDRVTVGRALRAAGIPVKPQTRWRIDLDGRECSKCATYKPWSEFYGAGEKGYGRDKLAASHQAACKLCTFNQPSRKNRRADLAKFGITPEEYAWLSDQQGGKCALCLRPETRSDRRWPGSTWSLAVDHDHGHCSGSTACKACIRGLLCASCNTLLGRVEQAGPPLTFRFSDYLGSRPFLREGGEAND